MMVVPLQHNMTLHVMTDAAYSPGRTVRGGTRWWLAVPGQCVVVANFVMVAQYQMPLLHGMTWQLRHM
jgi:hypothetical protein